MRAAKMGTSKSRITGRFSRPKPPPPPERERESKREQDKERKRKSKESEKEEKGRREVNRFIHKKAPRPIARP